MGTIRTIAASMLACMALAAFSADASAQSRSGNTSRQRTVSSESKTSSVRSTRDKKSATRPSTSSRPVASPSRPSSGTSGQPSRPGNAPSTVKRPATRPSTSSRPVASPSRPSSGTSGQPSRPGNVPSTVKRPAPRPQAPPILRPGQLPMRRVHPRDRDFMHYSRPSYYWTGSDHFYGHRVRTLPSRAVRRLYHGVAYYCYNDIWYRPSGRYYVVCRPPYGTVLGADLIAGMTWASVRFSYYSTVASTYRQINKNNKYIARQNEQIARNNALIAAQNRELAAGSGLADAAYGLADELGLVQSYAAAGTDYYYQDGVFYVKDSKGEYKVIVPPAGALVETLPEDYDIVTLKGDEYYKVDDTVYRVAINGGKPYFEVIGQMS